MDQVGKFISLCVFATLSRIWMVGVFVFILYPEISVSLSLVEEQKTSAETASQEAFNLFGGNPALPPLRVSFQQEVRIQTSCRMLDAHILDQMYSAVSLCFRLISDSPLNRIFLETDKNIFTWAPWKVKLW